MKGNKVMWISISFVVVFLFVAVVYYFGATFPQYNKLDPKEEFLIPGLDESFVPQGIEYLGDQDVFLVSGYMSDGSPSRVYVINQTTGEHKFVTIKHNGADFLGHMGGITSDGSFVWVAGDKMVLTLSLADVLASSAEVSSIAESQTGNGCDWITIANGKLLVGEFYRKDKYETPAHHRIGENSAVGYVYEIDSTKQAGFDAQNVIYAISLPNDSQGMVVLADKIVVSTSFSIPKSHIKVYNNVLTTEAGNQLMINGKNVPLYELNSASLTNDILAPCMTEEITIVGDRIFIMYESACKKYKLINRTRIENVISIGVENL